MSVDLTHPANVSPDLHSLVRASVRHRKRSSSLYELAELRLPSPPLSPSVSINFAKDPIATGEIPIIFDFLTTGSMASEERISKMASLEPALPPLVKFSPMSAFFPMSDSTGTLNTISTEAFGTKRPRSHYSETNQRRLSLRSDYPGVYSPLNADFSLSSPTEAVNHEAHSDALDSIASSASMPAVHVQDYDVGQKTLGDMSSFTISAYLSSSADGDVSSSLESLNLCGIADDRVEPQAGEPIPSECGSRILPALLATGLLSAPSTPDLDDKTPTQSTFLKRRAQNYFDAKTYPTNSVAEARRGGMTTPELTPEGPSAACGDFLTAPTSRDYDDKTPTQAMFLKYRTEFMITTDQSTTGDTPTTVTKGVPQRQGALPVPNSLDFDDKTPTQTSYLPRKTNLDALPLTEPSHRIIHTDAGEASSLQTPPRVDPVTESISLPRSRDKELPAEPTIEESDDATLVNGPTIRDPKALRASTPRTALPVPVPCLRHAQWLRDIIVELWIDQEGFRAIRPKFFLASISNGLPYSYDDHEPGRTTELPEEADPLYTTVAEFLPVSRAASYFHHAPLDRGPTLHRITTGDETKDYITRAATISLRDNGVFFVQGTEDHRIDMDNFGGGGRIIRLNWRFEYFVSSRRPDGRSAHKGEKLITPLSFSCTPALLDRTRAHKVTVLHIMKKTLLPNLVAQKLEPPDLPMLQTCASVSTLMSLMSTTTQPATANKSDTREPAQVASPDSSKSVSEKTTGQRTRRGSTSSSEHAAGISKKHTQPFAPPRLKLPPLPPLPHTKHRRGSHSATTPDDYMRQHRKSSDTHTTHERSRSASILQRGPAGRSCESPSNSRSNGNAARASAISGPIIPQKELMKMLDSDPGSRAQPATNTQVVQADRRPHSIRIELVNNVQVTTLPAAPRHRYNP